MKPQMNNEPTDQLKNVDHNGKESASLEYPLSLAFFNFSFWLDLLTVNMRFFEVNITYLQVYSQSIPTWSQEKKLCADVWFFDCKYTFFRGWYQIYVVLVREAQKNDKKKTFSYFVSWSISRKLQLFAKQSNLYRLL
jgi:hypothetical protein